MTKGTLQWCRNYPAVFAYGENEELALQEIKTAIDLWLSTARDMGRDIPKPQGREVLRDFLALTFPSE
ncbi:MAG: hypothetical protein WC342_00640 [Methanoregula sp.]|jgi:predicted RNase H-like HicB family nuclease